MALPDDLRELSRALVNIHPGAAHQASLRRAVSTAYYALFHLLIYEATANWARPELRAELGRCFDHGPMKTASGTAQISALLRLKPFEDPKATVPNDLHTVAKAFVQAQQRRNEADYNMAKEWTRVEAEAQIAEVDDAFEAWHRIRDEDVAQAYLVSLLGAKGRRSNEPQMPQKPK